MIILTDCLSERVDEGAIKVASSLVTRIKQYYPETTVVSYKCQTNKSDAHLQLNKLFLNRALLHLLLKKKEPVLYIPFASNTKGSVLRTFILSLFCKQGLNVLFALRHPMDDFTVSMLKHSKATVFCLSFDSWEYYEKKVGNAVYLRTGVDTNRFQPISDDMKKRLRTKYNIPHDAKVVLHVGHLNWGRNIDKLLLIKEKYHVLLVVSSTTMKDEELRRILEKATNITIIDSYVEAIEEIYQLADIYLFPVQESEHCIDVPLSVLEAASCNLPVVTTEYGEMKAFKGKHGFSFLDDVDAHAIDIALGACEKMRPVQNRQLVLAYDWEEAVDELMRRSDATK